MEMKINKTPLYHLMDTGKARIWIKRDDLIPFSFGGNKVRIASEFFKEAGRLGADTVISYGSTSSNLNRVMAHMASFYGKKCIIITKKEDSGDNITFNERLIRETCAEIRYCTRDTVGDTVEKALEDVKSCGGVPCYIYGDRYGNGMEHVLRRAYSKVFEEILVQEKELGVHFRSIFVTVGTGSTFYGLAEACDESRGIRGISVARDAFPDSRISCSYTCGGYGIYTPETEALIKSMLTEYALPLDPVYTGKAFCGMLKELEKEDTEGDVLFIHTGGTPLLFDYLQRN